MVNFRVYGRPLRLCLSFFLSFFLSLQTTAFSQVAALQEQDAFSLEEKQRLVNFYWSVSQQLVQEGEYERAIFQAQRIYDIEPENAQVAEFVKRIERRTDAVPSARERAQNAKKFIYEQERLSRDNVDGTYLPDLQKEFESMSDGLKEEKRAATVSSDDRGFAAVESMDDFVPVAQPFFSSDISVSDQSSQKFGGTKDGAQQSQMPLLKEEVISQVSKEKLLPAQDAEKKSSTFRLQSDAEIKTTFSKVNEHLKNKNFDNALFLLNELLITNPNNVDALKMKNDVLEKRRIAYEDLYESKRQEKAELFRKKITDKNIDRAENALKDIEEQEKMIFEIEKKKREEDKKREARGERLTSEDPSTRIMMQESKELDLIISEVEESQFYAKFKDYDEQKNIQEMQQRRQVNSFLLRAEGLMEMGKYSEAAVYLNNVFMVDPYNSRAQKMRIQLEKELVKKEIRDQNVEDELFRKEKKEYLRIKERVLRDKVNQLYRGAKEFYAKEDWLSARQETQKVLIIDPSNRNAQKLMNRIDEKLVLVQKEIEGDEDVATLNRSAAMDEALQEAARAVELEIIKEKQGSIGIAEHVTNLVSEAEKKIVRRGDYQGALIDLNRAASIDPANEAVRSRIKEVRELKASEEKGLSEAKEKPLTVTHLDSSGNKATISSPRETQAEKLKKEAAEKEERWNQFNRGKEIKASAVRKAYQEKVEDYAKKARMLIDAKQFDKAKAQVERIFLLDPNNSMAKDMLEEITAHEVKNIKTDTKVLTLDKEFNQGIEVEKLKESIRQKAENAQIVAADETGARDEETQKKAIQKLLKEGKKLYKQKRYFEAQQKYEAVFAIDANNKTASKYIDKVTKAMLEESEAERSALREKQRKEINDKLDRYSADIHQYHSKGKYTEAAIMIEKGLLLDPSNKYFKELKKLNERGMKDQLKVEINPDEEKQNLINLAIKEYIQGNYLDAKKFFEKVLEIDPNDEKALNSIAKLNVKIEAMNLGQ
jgi:tetratricopeptide (TPR) repeat protein